MISCGAAVTNLTLAVRALGCNADVALLPDHDRPEVLAHVTAPNRMPADGTDLARYWAAFRRRSYRHPFTDVPVDATQLATLIGAGSGAHVAVHPITEPCLRPVAALLAYAATVVRADRAYQRELGAWTDRYAEHYGPQSEVPGQRPAPDTLPWAGLVRPSTRIPDVPTLAHRMAQELTLAVVTDDDTALDQMRAGMAAQRVWLAAVAEGLAGNLITQPLHLSEVRDGLVQRLSLPGFPQALLRIGHPNPAFPA
jgi:nitroreductase